MYGCGHGAATRGLAQKACARLTCADGGRRWTAALYLPTVYLFSRRILERRRKEIVGEPKDFGARISCATRPRFSRSWGRTSSGLGRPASFGLPHGVSATGGGDEETWRDQKVENPERGQGEVASRASLRRKSRTRLHAAMPSSGPIGVTRSPITIPLPSRSSPKPNGRWADNSHFHRPMSCRGRGTVAPGSLLGGGALAHID
ncbi:hypothetical protein BDY21DRAFT_8460 [Lineolata rhizophorae]|uniref:Uncharacterized protein n=1 Tax=Lineolata rhizophorae TaxID=578093 RepID=A0A6A6PDY4_9PEZI|nr:hypothetical protein BDY21DRAFT_8460 [Lineolata rhizophorae]